MLLTIENTFKFNFKSITENCGNKYTTILHNNPNEKI